MTTITTNQWKNEHADLGRIARLFIDGKFVETASTETIRNISPGTGETLVELVAGGQEEVDRAVRSARAAFESWSQLPPRSRKDILLRFAALVADHTEELAALMTADMGKPIDDARGEVAYSARNIQWMAEAVDKVYGDVAPVGPDAFAVITKEPLGVVAAIVPWNYPLLMAVWKIAPALASGNTVVLKPAAQASLVNLRLAELGTAAGLPDGVLNVVPGRGDVAGKALALHMDVDAVTFTGSTSVGRLIMQYAAQSNLKRVSLELGGKSPSIVLADVEDLDTVAKYTAGAIFVNSGQMCDASSRLIVHESIAESLVEKIREAAAEWQPSDPFVPGTKMGPMVDERQMNTVLEYIGAGKAEGATVAFGGRRTREETGGYYIEPTVLTGVSSDMRVAREEIFGPVLSVLTFRTEEEAIELAHDSEYGLAAAIWTRDVTKAHRLSRKLQAGTVYVNCYDLGDISLPHGGFKQSGFGRDKSLYAFENYTNLKTTYINLLE
jgi:acyl-CoA reductase-like NAD-dependent aldehyde dehydrogenase